MEHIFLLLSVSTVLCAGNYSHLGTGGSMAVCQPDTCALLSEVAAMRERLTAATETQSSLQQNLGNMMQQMATVQANLNAYKTQAEDLIKINLAQDEKLKALVDVSSAVTAKMAFTAALGSTAGPVEKDIPLKYQRILSNIGSGYNPATGIFTAMVRGDVLLQLHHVQQQLRAAQLCAVPDDEHSEDRVHLGHGRQRQPRQRHQRGGGAAGGRRQRVRAALRKQSPLRRRLLLQHLQWLPALHLVIFLMDDK
ncbi:hypothetical protein OYC64_006873 [Pagothenia borchgrevinki]|uniref:C1q domain-containing protein n=1 Tax=Pagothenia borchgrevinki TaxID=8213 RepID=A0ABD2G2H2_PAGBO